LTPVLLNELLLKSKINEGSATGGLSHNIFPFSGFNLGGSIALNIYKNIFSLHCEFI